MEQRSDQKDTTASEPLHIDRARRAYMADRAELMRDLERFALSKRLGAQLSGDLSLSRQ